MQLLIWCQLNQEINVMCHPVQTTPIKRGVYLLGIVEQACVCESDLQPVSYWGKPDAQLVESGSLMTLGPKGNVLEGREQWSYGQQSGKRGNRIELKKTSADSCVHWSKCNQRKYILAPWKGTSVNAFMPNSQPQRAKWLLNDRQKQTLLTDSSSD